MNRESTENKELVAIVYFDTQPDDNVRKRIDLLREINDYVLFYSNIDQCFDRIQLNKKEKIILIISENDFVSSISRTDQIRQIDAIFLVCVKLKEYDQFKEKITGIFTNDDDMIDKVRKQIEIIHKQLEIFSFYRRHQCYIRNLKIASAEFLWFHVFKYIVIRLPHDEDAKKEMLDASRQYYRDNTRELERIDQFEGTYKSEDAIQWYTKNSFVYRLINKALRTEDIEQLYIFRYFIQDLCSALRVNHQVLVELGLPITVYRGLRLRQAEFDDLVNDEQKLISMNGYLSTSVTPQVAQMYAGKSTPTSDKLSVLLEIECDVEKLGDSVVFAYIASQSNFRDEYEVLFDIGTTFQLTTKPKLNDDGVWYLKMAASDKGRVLLQEYINDNLEFSAVTSPKIMFGVLLYDMGKHDMSFSYFERLLANPEGEDLAFIHLHIARALNIRGDTTNEWKHHEQAYEILMNTEPKRFHDIADVLIHMGIFHSDRNKNDQALEYFMRALHLFEQAFGDRNAEQARALLCIGGQYESKGEYAQALHFYDRALAIYDENPNLNHRVQCSVLMAKGNTYRFQGKYDDALVQFRRALDIRSKTLPEQHPEIADCLSMIGKTLDDMDKPSEAIMYSLRALDMYNKTLPSTELLEKSSVLVDLGLVFSAVEVDEISITYYHRALAMKKKCLSRDHSDFAVIFEHLGHSYSCVGKHILALKYAFKALHFYKRIGMSNHPDIAGSLRTLAHIYSTMGCFSRAMHYLIHARKILRKNVPVQHPARIDVRRQIIRLKKKINKRKRQRRKRIRWTRSK